MKKIIVCFLLPLIFVFCLSACSGNSPVNENENVLMSYNNSTIAVPTGAIENITVKNKLTGADVVNYDNIDQCVHALLAGEVDAVAFDRIVLENYAGADLEIVDAPITQNKYAYAVKKGNLDLLVDINMALASIKNSGLYDEAVKRWTGRDSVKIMPELQNDGLNGTLTFAFSTDVPPCSYGDGNGIQGLDVELAYRIGAFLGKKVDALQVDNTNYEEFLRAVETGGADVIAGLFTVTYDRQVDLDFTNTVMEGETVLLVKK